MTINERVLLFNPVINALFDTRAYGDPCSIWLGRIAWDRSNAGLIEVSVMISSGRQDIIPFFGESKVGEVPPGHRETPVISLLPRRRDA